MRTFFYQVLDLQKTISSDFEVSVLPSNIYESTSQITNQNAKLVAAIFQIGRFILELTKQAKMIKFGCEVIIKLLQTAIMFKRTRESHMLLEIFNQFVVDDDDPEEAKQHRLTLLEAKINSAECVIALNMYDDGLKQIEINAEQMEPELMSKHLNTVCKYYRVRKQYLPLAAGLVNYLRVQEKSDMENMPYYIEAQILLSLLPIYKSYPNIIYQILDDNFTLNDKQKKILLFASIPQIIDLTNTVSQTQGIRCELKAFLDSNSVFQNVQFSEYLNGYLKTCTKYEPDYIKNAVEKLVALTKIRMEYLSFSDLQIRKIVKNYL